MHRVGIVGVRHWLDYERFRLLVGAPDPDWSGIVTGDASGVDALARRYARNNDLPLHVCSANWTAWGKAAGPIRNTQIIALADELIAMWDGRTEGSGTHDSIVKARRKGIPLRIYLVPRQE